MSEDRLVEIRDLLAQLVQMARDTAQQQKDMQAAYRAAAAAQRRWLMILLPLPGLLVALCLYLVIRSL